MAEGWAHHLKGELIEPYSAGIQKHGLNPNAVQAMSEVDVDITSQTSNTVDELGDVKFDYVVTVCGHADENCPAVLLESTVVHVGFDDPPKLAAGAENHDQEMIPYRRVRDEIKKFIESLPESLSTQ